jgi:hypothetical protein
VKEDVVSERNINPTIVCQNSVQIINARFNQKCKFKRYLTFKNICIRIAALKHSLKSIDCMTIHLSSY